MEDHEFTQWFSALSNEQQKQLSEACSHMLSGVKPPAATSYLVPQEIQVFNPHLNLYPLLFQAVAKSYKIEMILQDHGMYIEFIIPSDDIEKISYDVFSTTAFYQLLRTKSTEDILIWIQHYGFLVRTEDFMGLKPYPLLDIVRRVNRLKEIWAIIDQVAQNQGPLLNKVKQVPFKSITDETFWGTKQPSKTLLDPLSTDADDHVLVFNGHPLMGTHHKGKNISTTLRNKLILESIATLILHLTKDDRHISVTSKPCDGLLQWRITTETACLSPENYYLLWILQFLSSPDQKPCVSCKKLFLPYGERPGKQKYCPSCHHGAQNTYKKKLRSARDAVKQEGLTINEAASLYNVSHERLTKIVSGQQKL